VTPALRLREAVRAVVLDRDDRVLLVRFEFPDKSLWACPGGGVDAGESETDALARELREEAGLESYQLGPCIWHRTHVIPLFGGAYDGQVERFYLVRVAPFPLQPRFTPEELAAEHVVGLRWWTPGELAQTSDLFAPRKLPQLLARLVENGPPSQLLDAGV
jgi:8-oxo-dGTP pyrophosphatase MutT (NUDIX family)